MPEIYYYGIKKLELNLIFGSGRYDGIMEAWSLGSKKLLKSIQTKHETLFSIEALGKRHLAYSNFVEGNTIFTAGSGSSHIYVWDFNTQSVVNKLTGHLQDVRTLKLWNDVLISGSNDHTVKVRIFILNWFSPLISAISSISIMDEVVLDLDPNFHHLNLGSLFLRCVGVGYSLE